MKPKLLEIVLDHPASGPVGLDEDATARASRERLEPHRARAREEIENGGVVDRADQVVGGLADAVARGTRRLASGCGDSRAAAVTGDDPHRCDQGGRQRGRRRTASPRRPSSRGGDGGAARPVEELLILAQPREPEIREPGLPRAEQLTLAADLEVPFGELEAVGRLHHRLETVVGDVGELLLRARDEQAVRLLRPAPDAAAELVELGEAEAVGLLHDHDRRVRDVDADLDHRRGDEHIESRLP